jgi:thioredoxin-like negative regulator of GroEL
MVMRAMTRQVFLDLVFNYEVNKEWNYQGDLPCLIDFHDDECPPCISMVPILEKLSQKYEKKVIFYKVNTKEEEILSRELGISNLPTLVLCPTGAKPVVVMGAINENKLTEKIETELLDHG